MHFRFLPLEFDYLVRSPLHLAEGKATNIVRGALGLALRRQCCPSDCADSRHCPYAEPCLYQQLFEGETGGPRASGYQEPPRPYVLRAADCRERTIAPGEHFVTSMHLFDPRPATLLALLRAYASLGDEGLGPGRAPLTLHEIRQPGGRILSLSNPAPAFLRLDLEPATTAPSRVEAHFLTPTEIKVRGEIAEDAAFAPLFARLCERLRFLLKHYGGEEVDPAPLLDAAKGIVTVRQQLRPIGLTRFSTRTRQTHPLAGFVGEATYEGDFTLLWPWLKASEWTGVGRQTVWGKGAVRWVPR